MRPPDQLDATSLPGFEGVSSLNRVAITGGPVVTIGRPGGTAMGATWGADGTIIVATNDWATGLQRIADTGGEPTDLARLAVLGTPVMVEPEVPTNAGGAVAADGTLVYASGDGPIVERSLVWVDRQGRETPIPGAPPRNYAFPRLSPDGTRSRSTSPIGRSHLAVGSGPPHVQARDLGPDGRHLSGLAR